MVGRPKKYNEKLQNISIALEPTFIAKLESEADEKGFSRNEYITSLLISADKELAQNLLKEYEAMREALKQQIATTKTYMEQLDYIQKKSMTNYIFDNLEDIPQLNKYVEEFADKIRANKEQNEKWEKGLLTEQPLTTKVLVENLSKIILQKFEDDMLTQNKIIKNKKLILSVIKKKLLEVGKNAKTKKIS